MVAKFNPMTKLSIVMMLIYISLEPYRTYIRFTSWFMPRPGFKAG
jgi:hypothetical protein